MDKLQSLAQFTPSDGHTYRLEATETPAPSRPRTLGNTPYSPATPHTPVKYLKKTKEKKPTIMRHHSNIT